MISKTFAYHNPSQEAVDTIGVLRRAFTDMEKAINALCPNSREKSVAMTHLETAAMWAAKSVVSNDPRSKALTEE